MLLQKKHYQQKMCCNNHKTSNAKEVFNRSKAALTQWLFLCQKHGGTFNNLKASLTHLLFLCKKNESSFALQGPQTIKTINYDKL
jgi:hypothetical protein